MKASELIYRLARAIEERGDLPVTVAVEVDANPHFVANAPVKCLDVNTNTYGFEIYGEE
ncbi:MAG: hypothetical protein ABJG42_24665 [Vibrio splendidus]